MSDMLVQFGKKLRKIRLEREVSQEDLARLASLHRTYVSSVELGRRNVSLLNVQKLAVALDVSLAELMP